MKIDDILFRNYNELYYLIMQCYEDVSLIDAYLELKTNKLELFNMVAAISNHVIFLVQKDLALTIWKIYFDRNAKANTVPKYRNSVNKLLRESGLENRQIGKCIIDNTVKEKIELLRKKYLAHTDMTRSDNKIEISILNDVLNSICEEFNSVCDVFDEKKVYKINDYDIDRMKWRYRAELMALYQRS